MRKHVCLWNTIANISRIGLTFDLMLSPTDKNIDKDHILIKDYLPTKFEAFGAKSSWVISCTRCGRPTWPLRPTDLNINRDHLLIKDYLPTKFEASVANSSWVISCTRCGRTTWLLTLTFDLLAGISLIKDYLPTEFEASRAKGS